MRQPARIDRTAAEPGAESGVGARRALVLGMLGAGALVGLAAPAASAAATGGPGNQAHPADWSRFGQIKLYPLAGTGVDPLSNVVGTNLSGLPVSTAPINAVFADGLPLRDLPVVGALFAPAAAAPPATAALPAAAPAAGPAQ